MNFSPQIVHESETQRQYVRLQIPAHVEIEGQPFSVKDLSSAGLAIRDIGSDIKKNQILNAVLILPFSDFKLDLDLKIEIQHIDKKLKTAGCRFIDLSAQQISSLNHIMKSFMTGDLVSGQSLIEIVSRENFATIRKDESNTEESISEKIKKSALLGLVVLMIVGLSFFIVNNILERMFVIKTANAYVHSPQINILSPVSGLYELTIPENSRTVKKDQIIARIKHDNPSTGLSQYTNIISPCDCFIKENIATPSLYHPQDSQLLTLLPQNNATIIKVNLPLDNVHQIKIGTAVIAKITGFKKPVKGSVSKIEFQNRNFLSTEAPNASIDVKLQESIAVDNINAPTYVEFNLRKIWTNEK